MIHALLVCPAIMAALAAPQFEPDARASALVVEGCSLFDPVQGRMLPDRTIVIVGDRIRSVVEPGGKVDEPAGATRIDARGKFVIPGLIDAHVHVVHVLDYAHMTGDEVLPLYLAAGVTSIRSTGDEIVAATLVRRVAEAHPEWSPRVFTCTPLLDADPPIHRDVGLAVINPSQVAAILDDMKTWGVTTAKIYAGTQREIGRTIIQEGHKRGLFVTAHLGPYTAQDAVADGLDGIEHITSVYKDAFSSGGDGGADRTRLDNPRCDALIAEMVRRGTFVDPTLSVFRNMILLPDVPEVRDHPDVALVPRRLREFWPVYLARTGCPQGGSLEARRLEFARYQQLTGKMQRAGVRLLVGTDSPEPNVTPGFSMHQELERLVESGLSPADALSAATRNNAEALRQTDQLGSLAAGKLADFLILSANPLDDIRNTRRIEIVVRGGVVSRPDELLQRVPKE